MGKKICISFERAVAGCKSKSSLDGACVIASAPAALKALQEKGYTIILKTEFPEDKVKEFLEKADVPYNFINEHMDEADIYVDTKNVTFYGDWRSTLYSIAALKDPENVETTEVDRMKDILGYDDDDSIYSRGGECRICRR